MARVAIGRGRLYDGLTFEKLVPVWAMRGVVFVPDAARKSVVFLGNKEDDNFRPRATGFLAFTSRKGGDFLFPHLITAEHVVSGMLTRGWDIHCRVNLWWSDSAATFPIDPKLWRYHPDESQRTDVAVCPFVPPFEMSNMEHQCIWLPNPAEDDRQSPGYGLIAPQTIGLGDEIFIVGLFRSHHGKQRNVPIVRIGNIAAMLDEPVYTRYAGYIEAYLAEVRSVGGLSGSPVFVHIPRPRLIDKTPPGTPWQPETREVDREWFQYHFLGLVHGHFDLPNLTEDSVVEDDQEGHINTGIGVIIPAKKILETLYQPDLVKEREELERKLRKDRGATPDFDSSPDGTAESEQSTKPDNPRHKEAFNSLVDAAAKKRRQGD